MTDEAPIKIYIDDSTNVPPVFRITPDLVTRARETHPGLDQKVDIRVGSGRAAFLEGMKDAEVLVGWDFPTGELRGLAQHLRWIQLIGAGLDHLLPLNWVPAGVVLTRASGAHRPKADEFMMLSLLMLNNRIPEIVANQHRRKFSYVYETAIAGKTALLVGLGATGTAAAASCRKLGLRVLGIRETTAAHDDVDELGGVADLRAFLPRADFLVVTVPKTSHTLGLIGRDELKLLKPGAGIIDLSRLGVIDEAAMLDLLDEGHLSGVVYDIQDPVEVPSPTRLWSTDKIILIPHSLNNDPNRFMLNSLSIFFDNLDRYLNRRPLLNRVNVAKEY